MVRSGHKILNNLSWQTELGQHWVIMGPNGAGKTSVVRAVTGREHCDEGDIAVLGHSVDEYAPEDLGSIIGFASSSLASRLRPGLTAREVVKTAAWGQSVSFAEEYEELDEQRAIDVLAAFGVDHVAERRFSTLSEGERQRALLARALMADPQVLILDEPTAGLDLGARETLMQALTEIMSDPRSPQVIIVTHHMEEIPLGVTHALLLKDGQVNAAGPISDVLTGVEVSELFDVPLNVTTHEGRWSAHAVHV